MSEFSLFSGESSSAASRGMGGHHSPASETVIWLTPPEILAALGPFDLDPCACSEPRPWPTAEQHYTIHDNGLRKPWFGRVWLNPPYGQAPVQGPWLRRMKAHGHGTALIFARTETALFFETIWHDATAMLFLEGRLFFHHPCGKRAGNNAGAPSVLVAYGGGDAEILRACGLAGKYVDLREKVAA